uniref:BTB domain-containing protein n=1 Tax=Panagrellus redivivus TaxID=6233 RepID=A0A7E4UU57_PANRE
MRTVHFFVLFMVLIKPIVAILWHQYANHLICILTVDEKENMALNNTFNELLNHNTVNRPGPFWKTQIRFQSIACCQMFLKEVIDAHKSHSNLFLIVDGKQLPITPFLILHSPVFDTILKTNNTTVITDYDYSTVDATLDLCHFDVPDNKSVQDAIKMHDFAHKYKISTAFQKIESYIISKYRASHFCIVAQYAFENQRKSLQYACADYFREKGDIISNLPEFKRFDDGLKEAITLTSVNLGWGPSFQFIPTIESVVYCYKTCQLRKNIFFNPRFRDLAKSKPQYKVELKFLN